MGDVGGCGVSDNKWTITELLAVGWSEDMTQRFPNADHTFCRQEMNPATCQPYDPVRCHGWHCNRCGAPTSDQGHHYCPDRPQP